MEHSHILLAHGNGGRFMRELIREVFAQGLGDVGPDTQLDAAPVRLPFAGELLTTTDGFTVQPLEFPGGNIGSLAVHGTVNDLAVAGADPVSLTLNAFIEEGTEVALLRRLVAAMAAAAREAGVRIVAGDTKILRRGEGGGVYLATAGIGVRPAGVKLSMDLIQAGDAILVSGPVGDHGTAVMLAREAFGLRGDLRSDAASVWPLTRVLRAMPGVRFMRDPTRGGIATVAHELAQASGLQVRLWASQLPVREPVRAVCDIVGYDPYYLACEGRVVVVVAAAQAQAVLAQLSAAGAPEAAIVGVFETGPKQAIVETHLGGERLLLELEDDPLPRIC
ncbi:hydrogenase expression/formation protein HypE [Magnetococcus marinus MC-1]|uniref:Hydrogenase expression/formation protein HypE n=1 Tax=Magnetococcus marinus (strain ATCC BAA-1437 / JCM 17883 / MC-1) TaxID=156889 RepID=A0LAJ3_MAGMM|nr:hydrogenase expression/formation protein HypE [Magnetococcus marinus]ABK44986.1 hydrogenase expression/formation protein HypE [Magnetococcus marinus MC-1]